MGESNEIPAWVSYALAGVIVLTPLAGAALIYVMVNLP